MSYGNETEPTWPRWGKFDPALAVQRRVEIKVGSVVFIYDVDRRVYFGGPNGNSHLSQRHQFSPEQVIGETKMSWLTGPAWRPTKHPKRDPRGLYGLADVEDALWRDSYANRLGDAVRWCGDVDKMRQIAEIVGFVP